MGYLVGKLVNFLFLCCDFPTYKIGQQPLLSCSGCENRNPAHIPALQAGTALYTVLGWGRHHSSEKNINHKEEIKHFFWIVLTKVINAENSRKSFSLLALPPALSIFLTCLNQRAHHSLLPLQVFGWQWCSWEHSSLARTTLCSCLLSTHSLRWALQLLQLETAAKNPPKGRIQVKNPKNFGRHPNVIGNHPTFNLQNSGFICSSTNVRSCTNNVLQTPPDWCVTPHALKTPV